MFNLLDILGLQKVSNDPEYVFIFGKELHLNPNRLHRGLPKSGHMLLSRNDPEVSGTENSFETALPKIFKVAPTASFLTFSIPPIFMLLCIKI